MGFVHDHQLVIAALDGLGPVAVTLLQNLALYASVPIQVTSLR